MVQERNNPRGVRILMLARRRWAIFVVPVLAGLLGYVLVSLAPPMYLAEGKLRAYNYTTAGDGAAATHYYDEAGSDLETHVEAIASRVLLKDVGMRLGYLPTGLSDEELAGSRDYVRFLEEFAASTDARLIPGTSIIEVEVTRPQPRQAVAWLNALLDTYVDRHSYEVNRPAIETVRYLEGQIARAGEELRQSEDRLVEFTVSNSGVINIGSDDLSVIRIELNDTEVAIGLLNLQIELLDDAPGYAGYLTVRSLGRVLENDVLVTKQLEGIAALEQRRSVMLSYQTPDSPEVRAAEEEIRGMLPKLRDQLVSARDQRERERRHLEQLLAVTSVNDVALNRLRRNVLVNERTYGQLREEYQRARLEAASLIREVTVIERALVATPQPPNGRLGTTLAAALVGLMAGVVIALSGESRHALARPQLRIIVNDGYVGPATNRRSNDDPDLPHGDAVAATGNVVRIKYTPGRFLGPLVARAKISAETPPAMYERASSKQILHRRG